MRCKWTSGEAFGMSLSSFEINFSQQCQYLYFASFKWVLSVKRCDSGLDFFNELLDEMQMDFWWSFWDEPFFFWDELFTAVPVPLLHFFQMDSFSEVMQFWTWLLRWASRWDANRLLAKLSGWAFLLLRWTFHSSACTFTSLLSNGFFQWSDAILDLASLMSF